MEGLDFPSFFDLLRGSYSHSKIKLLSFRFANRMDKDTGSDNMQVIIRFTNLNRISAKISKKTDRF